MSQQPRPAVPAARVVDMSCQPVRISAVLQSASTIASSAIQPTYNKVTDLRSDPVIVANSSNRTLCDTLSSSSQQNIYSEINADVVDDVVSCTEDDSNNDSLMRSAITGIDSLGETTTFQLLSQEEVEEHGLHAVAIGNDDAAAATVLQCSHGPDGQIFIPVQQLNSASLCRGFVVATSSTHDTSANSNAVAVQLVEETARRRQLRLLKNKEAAKECRRKKKEYVRCLENRVAVLENQNRTLIDELKSLKELYCQKDLHS